ncbi:MAG: alpha/beta fold hydrolase [Candidatus Nanopelagicales bacterium]
METFPRQAAATGQFRHGQARNFRVTGSAVYFLRSSGSRSSSLELHRWDRTTGATSTVLSGRTTSSMSDEERSMRERLRETASGITAYDVRDDRIVASAGGSLLVWDEAAGAREVPGAAGAFDPRLSPDGNWMTWVEPAGLHCRAWDGTQHSIVVQSEGEESWAVADFIAAEELSRSRGYWWLPDSTGILVQRTDDSPVPVWFRSDPAHPHQAPVAQRYPHAGADNARVELWRFDLSGEGERIGLPAFEYLAGVGAGVVTLLNREQTELTVCDYTGAILAQTNQQPWIDLVPGLPRIDPAGRLLSWIDDDRRRLSIDGEPVTGDVQLRALVGADAERVYVTACSDPAESRLAVVDKAGFRWLSEPGHYVTATAESGLLITSDVTWEHYRARVTVRDGEYAPLTVIENLAEEPIVEAAPQRLPSTPNAVQTVVLWPTQPSEERLPILMYPYGGPHAQRVLAARSAYASAQWLADQGFCVVVADGRGTPGQSPAWEQAVAGDLRDPALEDQVAALESVLEHFRDRLDPDRVGILGWSYGGYLAALAVLRRPDVFHAAVAGAPVTEWRLYDTAYTERYLGNPSIDSAPYDHSSLLPLAADLRRPLLLIHGLSDDNVFAAHTLELSTHLLRAGRPHEVLPLSGVTHMTPQPEVAENLLLLQVDFFRRHLG